MTIEAAKGLDKDEKEKYIDVSRSNISDSFIINRLYTYKE